MPAHPTDPNYVLDDGLTTHAPTGGGTQTGYGTVSGTVKVFDTGSSSDPWGGLLQFEPGTLDTGSGQTYSFMLEGFQNSDMSGTSRDLTPQRNTLVEGQPYIQPVNNLSSVDNTIYRYLAFKWIVTGTDPQMAGYAFLTPYPDVPPASIDDATTAMVALSQNVLNAQAQFRNWNTGTVDGGPNGDGNYVLSDGYGNEYLVPCPAKMQASLNGASFGLFTSLGSISVPATADVIQSSGYSVLGLGNATYKAITDTGQTETSYMKRSADGRLWQLANSIIEPEMVGAKGDNTTSDTQAFIDAQALGRPVRTTPGKTYYCATAITLIDGAIIEGKGKIRGGAQATISAIGKSNIRVSGVTVVAAGSGSASYAIYMKDCTDCDVDDVDCSNYRQFGVVFTGSCLRCKCLNSRFHDEAIHPTFGTTVASGVQIEMLSQRCQARGNTCTGCGYGIQIRTYRNSGTQHCDYHIVDGNTIDGTHAYGIMLYRDGPYKTVDGQQVVAPEDEPINTCYGCTVTNNIINNTLGDCPLTLNGSTYYPYGCAIYIQGAERGTFTGNTIAKAHSGAVTISENLSPGAIGLANTGFCEISGFTIIDSGFSAVYFNDSLGLGAVQNAGVRVGPGVIRTTAKRAIMLTSQSNVTMHDIDIYASGQNSIQTQKGSGFRPQNITIVDCNIYNGSLGGIIANYTDNLRIQGCLIRGCAIDAIEPLNCSEVEIVDNTMLDVPGRAVNIDATNTGYIRFEGNRAVANSGVTGNYGVIYSAPCIRRDNHMAGFQYPSGGTYSEYTVVTSGSTAELGGRTFIELNYGTATTVTDFTNATLGQREGERITVYFASGNITLAQGLNISFKNAQSRLMEQRSTADFIRRGIQWVEDTGNTDWGWTAGTGTALKTAWSTYGARTQPSSYSQSYAQLLDDGLTATSQRLLAIEKALRRAGIIT